MESLTKSLWIGAGAFIGANMRFWFGEWMGQRGAMVFPWGTFLINVAGSLAIGSFYAIELRYTPNFAYRLFFAVGICGGFTTFSTFSWEALRLMERGHFAGTLSYVLGSAVLSILACFLGFVLTRAMLGV
jgi:CrcB protein